MLARALSTRLRATGSIAAAVPRCPTRRPLLGVLHRQSRATSNGGRPPPPNNNNKEDPKTTPPDPNTPPPSLKLELPDFKHDLLVRKATPGTGGGKGADGLPKSAYVSSTDRRRERMARIIFACFVLGLGGGTLYLGRDLDKIESKIHPSIPQGWGVGPFTSRVKARVRDFLDFYNEPPFDKLLPDPLPDYSRPYTLVISLEDLCVHSTWDREHGWRIAKRPGLDYFLAYLFQYFEIVVFTSQHEQMAAPIIQKMDQYPGYVMYPLFRTHTVYKDGKYIKDLNYLNRDLSKVIMLETNPDAWSKNPDNTIKMAPWHGDSNDKELVSLIPFLEYIAAMGISDVRPVIAGFGDLHIPTEFARREVLARKELKKQLEADKSKRGTGGGGDWLAVALGLKRRKQLQEEQQQAMEEKTVMDLARERGKLSYEETQRHLLEHKEEMMKEQQRAEKEMGESMKTSLSKIFTEGLPKPPGQS